MLCRQQITHPCSFYFCQWYSCSIVNIGFACREALIRQEVSGKIIGLLVGLDGAKFVNAGKVLSPE